MGEASDARSRSPPLDNTISSYAPDNDDIGNSSLISNLNSGSNSCYKLTNLSRATFEYDVESETIGRDIQLQEPQQEHGPKSPINNSQSSIQAQVEKVIEEIVMSGESEEPPQILDSQDKSICENQPTEHIAAQDPPAEDPSARDLPAKDEPAEDLLAEDPPAEDQQAEDVPTEDPPAEDLPTEDPPAEDPPAEDPPAEDLPIEDLPTEDPPAEDLPTEDPPAEDVPTEDPPAEDVPTEDPPAEDVPTEDPPAEDLPNEDPPAEDLLTEDPPAEDLPNEDPPAEDLPIEDLPAEDPPAEDLLTEDPPAEDLPTEDPPAKDEPAQNYQVENVPAEEGLAEDEPAEDRLAENESAEPIQSQITEKPSDVHQPSPEIEPRVQTEEVKPLDSSNPIDSSPNVAPTPKKTRDRSTKRPAESQPKIKIKRPTRFSEPVVDADRSEAPKSRVQLLRSTTSKSTIPKTVPSNSINDRGRNSEIESGLEKKYHCEKCQYATDRLNNIVFHKKSSCVYTQKQYADQVAQWKLTMRSPKSNNKKTK